MEQQTTIKNGAACAAFLAAGIGSLALGVITTLAEAIPALKTALGVYAPAGPLSGKTGVAVIVWLVSWVGFHFAWKDKDQNFSQIFTIALALIALGFVGTFPVFYDMFTAK
jgi:hypothetical protein